MLSLVLTLLLAAVLGLYAYIRAKSRSMMELSEKIPGPKLVPILGNALEFGFKTEDFFYNLNRLLVEYGPILRIWLGPELLILLANPKHVEVVISTNKYNDKAFFYRFLVPWLGTGLLTSSGIKWKSHRKLITPTFHFKILEQFVEVFNKNGQILVDRLSCHAKGPEFDVFPYMKLSTLDVICESAMGVQVNAQRDNNSQYVKAVQCVGDVAMQRSFKPWIQPDAIFHLMALARTEKHSLATIHNTTNSVIRSRRKELTQQSKTPTDADDEDVGKKTRMAFLDMLLQSSVDGVTLTDEEIREEVDTFMFEGHDTTSSGISFTLWALAKHQDVQEKVFNEQMKVFGDSDRDATFNDLQEMKYLELVIKESQRLYPSVPLFGRVLLEDVEVEGYTLPAGCSIVFQPFIMHRNPEYFPDPEKFDPDRFLPENSVGRHPYSYIPFSAGPRNCIGQKFAMLEMKATVSKILRHYRLHLGAPGDKLDFIAELVLKSKNGIILKIEPRN